MAKDGILWTSSRDREAHQTCLLASAESLQRSLRHKNCRETAPLGLLARLLTQSPVLLRARLQGPRADVTPWAPEGRRRGSQVHQSLVPPLGSKVSPQRGTNAELSQVWGTQDTFGHHLEAGICTSSLFWKTSVQDTY